MNGINIKSWSEVDGGPVKLGPSVFWHFRRSLEENGNGEAIIVAHQRPDYLVELTGPSEGQKPTKTLSCLRWTYQQLHNAGVNLVAGLHKNGIPSGSKIVTLFPNCIEWGIILWASKLGKFTQSSFDVGLLTTPRRTEFLQMIQAINPDVIVVADTEGATALDQALETLEASKRPKLKVVLSANISEQTQTPRWASFLQLALFATPVSAETRSGIEANGLHDDLSRISDIMFTSGTTTGRPKGCPRTVAGSLCLIATQHWGPGCTGKQSKLHHTSHTNHNNTLTNGIVSPVRARIALAGQNFRIIAPSMVTSVWAAGGTIIMASAQPDFGALISAIPRFQVKSILLIPPGVNAISVHPNFGSLDQSSLESVSLGGDIVTRAIYERAATIFPKCEITVAHGMTEGGSAFYHPYMGRPDLPIPTGTNHNFIRFHSGIASLGKVNTGTRLKVSDDENKSVPRNQVGELHFSNPTIVRRYLSHEKPEDFYVEDFVDREGNATHTQWFKSGDLGIIDEDDWVWILGRKKDVIKRMGISVVPAALENSLNAFLHAETAIIPHPHATLGQVPIAVVTSQALVTNSRSKADIENHILDHFGKDYALGGVVTIEEIGFSAFPLNATGKIVKRELVEATSPFLEANERAQGP